MTSDTHHQLRTLLRQHPEGIPGHTLRALLMEGQRGAQRGEGEIAEAMTAARADGFAHIDETDGRWHQTPYAAAADRWESAKNPGPLGRVRDFAQVCFGPCWWKLWLAGFLLLTTVAGCMQLAHGQDIPDWVMRGIAHVETRTTWRDIGDLTYRDRRQGADGEVGPWQLSPAALEDMGVLRLRQRIHREPVLAESMTRAWLLRCYATGGTWLAALSIYHVGIHGDSRRGRNYAERVRTAGMAEASGASTAVQAAR